MADDQEDVPMIANPSRGDRGDESLVKKGDPEQKEKKGLWAWFKEAPLSRWPLLFFVLVGLLSFLWAAMELLTGGGYVPAGVCGVVMCGFAFYHFRILLNLKKEVDRQKELNQEFKQENVAMTADVTKLGRAREELGGCADDLQRGVERLKSSLTSFRKLNENLSALGGSNLEGLQHLQQTSAKMAEQWKQSLIAHERDMLMTIFDQYEEKDGERDLTEEEFKQVIAALPDAYQMRFRAMGRGFAEWAGDDGKVDVDEFIALLDTWIDAEVERKPRI